MGILDDLRSKVEKLGDKAREGFGDARDKAGDLIDDAKDRAGDLVDDAKDRLGQHDDERPPLTESSDVGADSSTTDAVQPGYVTAEDDASEDSDESSLEAEAELDTEDDLDETEVVTTGSDVVDPAAAELDPVDLDAQETQADETGTDTAGTGSEAETDPVEAASPAPTPTPTPTPVEAATPTPAAPVQPLVEKDVDPYEQPLTETIGEELANALAAQQARAGDETDLDAQA